MIFLDFVVLVNVVSCRFYWTFEWRTEMQFTSCFVSFHLMCCEHLSPYICDADLVDKKLATNGQLDLRYLLQWTLIAFFGLKIVRLAIWVSVADLNEACIWCADSTVERSHCDDCSKCSIASNSVCWLEFSHRLQRTFDHDRWRQFKGAIRLEKILHK